MLDKLIYIFCSIFTFQQNIIKKLLKNEKAEKKAEFFSAFFSAKSA